MTRLRRLSLLLFLLLPVLFLWKLTLAGRILVGLDPFNFFYPYHDALQAAIRAGRLPQWNATLFGGVPFLADSQAQLFYPPSWPFLLVSAPTALTWSITLHLAFAALGLYLWVRRGLGLGTFGAWISAVLFVLSGYLVAQIEHVNQVQAASWLPWLLLGYEMMRYGRWRHRVLGQPGGGPLDRNRSDKRPLPLLKSGEGGGGGEGEGDLLFHKNYQRALGLLLGAVALAMSLLAGHAQTTFISLVLLGLWALRGLVREFGTLRSTLLSARGRGLYLGQSWPAWRDYLAGPLLPLLLILPLGGLLAMGQLLPTQRLAALSQRAGGLSLPEAAAFSLDPRVLPRALLPSYGLDLPLHSEYMAWVAVGGAVLALVGLWRGRPWQAAHDFGIIATLAGLLLALGGYNPLYWLLWRVVPGFDLFRVPARWLLLYIIGMAVLAGLGAESVARHRVASPWRLPPLSRRQWSLVALIGLGIVTGFLVLGAWPPLRVLPLWVGAALGMGLLLTLAWRWPRLHLLIPVLLLVELWFGWRAFALQNATAPEAYSDLRVAPTHLIASQEGMGAGRLLSMSDLTWDPGDLASLQARHAAQLNEAARYDLVVSTKLKEVLAPNQPMRWNLATADGYGGGLLPTARWVAFQPTLPLAKIVPDGRLREQLTTLPGAALLNVMGVEWIVADKVYDWWQRDVYHDLGTPLRLTPGSTNTWRPASDEATALSFVVIGEWPQSPGSLAVSGRSIDLRDAEAGERRESPRGQEQHFWLPFPEPLASDELTLRADAAWQLGGLTLVDARLPGFAPMPADPFIQTTSSGDVKVYHREDGLGRAWLVGAAEGVATVEAAVEAVAAPDFDPRREAIIESTHPLPEMEAGSAAGELEWVAESPERIELRVETSSAAWLVLADAPAPGWHAVVNGQPTEWYAANVLNRALPLPPGEHTVEWRYEAPGLRAGVVASLVGVLLLLVAAVALWWGSAPRK